MLCKKFDTTILDKFMEKDMMNFFVIPVDSSKSLKCPSMAKIS